jgi:hypothetical protein
LINGTDAIARGRNELDELRGGVDKNRFILGDRNGSFYAFAGANDFASIRNFSNGDSIQLGSGATYRATTQADGNGFDLFVVVNGASDLVARVNGTATFTLPRGNFQINLGERIGFLVGA